MGLKPQTNTSLPLLVGNPITRRVTRRADARFIQRALELVVPVSLIPSLPRRYPLVKPDAGDSGVTGLVSRLELCPSSGDYWFGATGC